MATEDQQRKWQEETERFRAQSATELNRQLQEWQGSSATIWGYRVSHSHLTIRLWRDKDEVYVRCLHCERMSIPAQWKDVRLQVVLIAHEFVPYYLLLDQDASLVVTCGRVELVPLPDSVFLRSPLEPIE
jgi:hypothetical protein